ncbi:uncharacterized protein [Nicotiana sylvestris]|uniref:uncharacterized protein n=1 Tax=Nicotiana sylvestris TaxID=4096 RepID=UPI00388CCE08
MGNGKILMNVNCDMGGNICSYDDIDRLLNDKFRDVAHAGGVYEGPNEYATKFYNLVDDASQELYPGCKGFSGLSFIICLYLLKCLHGWSNASFTSLLELLKEAMLELNIPISYNKAKSMVKDLGLDYEKIDACPNDCMLFRNDHNGDEYCHVCGASRYAKYPEVDSDLDVSKKGYRIPTKILRHFPLIHRLKRLFICSKTVDTLRWNNEKRSKDGKLRHPADGQAWKDFDSLHSEFARDSCNLRLGLASDRFNPFRTISISHSTWPIILMVYNLPPWMCMKLEYCMLSLLIPGPRSPGSDIDVYLQPLIEELNVLWEYRVETYDASRDQIFQMRAALLWTISDFPAYAMLFGWSTKGMLPPPLLNGTDVLNSLKNFNKVFGKKRKRTNDGPWKKRQKNHENARYDLKEMGIRKNLQPKDTKDGKRKKCVQLDERKLSDYKTHDAHFMLHYLLPIPVKSILPDHVSIPLIRLSSFFRRLCQKVITIEELYCLEEEIRETTNQLERIFPPTFFDIMIHLPIHFANEVRLGGPVQNRWMYPPERNMCTLKSYVRNRNYLEGSIAEAYLVEKCCPLGAKKSDPIVLDDMSINQAHIYLLNNCDKVQEYIREYEVEVSNQRRVSKWSKAKNHSQNFSQWFETPSLKEDVPDLIKQLSFRPNSIAKRYSGYLINRYRFHTRQRDGRRKIQNSGVILVSLTTSFASSKDKNPIDENLTYYGRIVDIVELGYYGHFRVVLFKCNWYEIEEDIYGLTYIYFNKKCYQNKPFVLPSQPSEYLAGPSIPEDNGEVTLVRSDVPATILDVHLEGFLAQQLEIKSDEEFDFEDTS